MIFYAILFDFGPVIFFHVRLMNFHWFCMLPNWYYGNVMIFFIKLHYINIYSKGFDMILFKVIDPIICFMIRLVIVSAIWYDGLTKVGRYLF